MASHIRVLPLAVAAALLALASAAVCHAQRDRASARGARRLRAEGARPNIVLILTDDEDAVMGTGWYMSKLRRWMGADTAANFTSFVANLALCCPARASILMGACAHNTGVVGLGSAKGPPGSKGVQLFNPLGGFARFYERGLENQTAPYLLHRAGYRTGLIGKYLTGYNSSSAAHVPPGWDRWFVFTSLEYYNYTVSDDGRTASYGNAAADYSTDVLTEQAVAFVRGAAAAADRRPFFLYLAPYGPHYPHMPAERHVGALPGLRVPRTPSFNASGGAQAAKASFMRGLPPLDAETAAGLDFKHRARAETLLSVDDQVDAVFKVKRPGLPLAAPQALEETGQLDNTYVFYTSDNGYKLGQHRISGKMSGYEEDVRLPLVVRGPRGGAAGELPHLLSNVDLAPTWLELAGVDDPLAAKRDGISMAPLLRGDPALLADPKLDRVATLLEKPVPNGMMDVNVSILVPPAADPAADIFLGFRPQRLPNGSWPLEVLATEYQGEWYNNWTTARIDRALQTGTAALKSEGWRRLAAYALANNVTYYGLNAASNEYFPVAYYGLRVDVPPHGRLKYLQYPQGHELYNLTADPWEVDNIFGTAPADLLASLQQTLDGMKVCAGAGCVVRSVNVLMPGDGPPDPLPFVAAPGT